MGLGLSPGYFLQRASSSWRRLSPRGPKANQDVGKALNLFFFLRLGSGTWPDTPG
jgi:hypothetical protein